MRIMKSRSGFGERAWTQFGDVRIRWKQLVKLDEVEWNCTKLERAGRGLKHFSVILMKTLLEGLDIIIQLDF